MSGALSEARAAYERLNDAWLKAATDHGYKDEWDAIRREADWKPELREAWSAQNAALHAFYTMRDGPAGVLGGRGL